MDALQLLMIEERAVRLARRDNTTGECLADARHLCQLGPRCRIEFDLKLGLERLSPIDFDQGAAVTALGEPIQGHRRQSQSDEHGDRGLVGQSQKRHGGALITAFGLLLRHVTAHGNSRVPI